MDLPAQLGKLKQDKTESGCYEVIFGAPTTLHGYGIDKTRLAIYSLSLVLFSFSYALSLPLSLSLSLSLSLFSSVYSYLCLVLMFSYLYIHTNALAYDAFTISVNVASQLRVMLLQS